MIWNVIAIGIVALLGYVWSRAGLFSGILHLVCTVASGAIAFGLWEPLAMAILNAAPPTGLFSFLEGVAWTAGLVLPFAVSLFITRLAMDMLVPGNLSNQSTVNLAGGAVTGALSAYLAVGILTIAGGFLRLPDLLGHKPVKYESNGSVVRAGGLWIAADRVVAGLFSHMSSTSLRTTNNLARWYPDLDTAGYALQLSINNGSGRNAIKPAELKLERAFRVGPAGGAPLSEVMRDIDGVPQRYTPHSGEPPARANLYGYILALGPGAKEDVGQVVFSGGQLRLVAHDEAGASIAIYPVGAIGQNSVEDLALYRYAFDSASVFIPSVGGAASVNMGFEFAVPAGYTPGALYVKNTRLDVRGLSYVEYATPEARIAALSGGALGTATSRVEDIDRTEAASVTTTAPGNQPVGNPGGLSISNRLPFVVQTTQLGGLNRDGDNLVTSGKNTWFKREVGSANSGIARNLRVDRFAVGAGQIMVHLDVSPDQPGSLLGRTVRQLESVLPPQLVDQNGTAYACVGYIYEDNETYEVAIDIGNPIRGLSQVPSISASRSDQRLTLIFVVSNGANISSFLLGNKSIVDFDPPVLAQGRQN